MANALKMKIATLESLLVTSAECPCTNGYIGILPGHAPLVGALGAGTLSYIPVGASSQKTVKLSGGFIQVLDNSIRVLADSAELS